MIIDIISITIAIVSSIFGAYLAYFPKGKKEIAKLKEDIEKSRDLNISSIGHMNNLYIRLVDLLLSSTFILLFAPLILLITISVFCEDRQMVFTIQKSIGKNNKDIDIYRFRTMKLNDSTCSSKSINRITRVGAFLRKTSLYVLPILFNILKGDISFFGLRLMSKEFYNSLPNEIKTEYFDVFKHSKPGLVSLPSILCMLDYGESINADKFFAINDSASFRLRMQLATTAAAFYKKKL